MCEITKKCNACLEEKCITDFGVDKSTKDGLRPKCKICRINKIPIFKLTLEKKITKICVKCSFEKPIDYFGILNSSKDGHNRKCKTCVNSEYVKKIIRVEGYKKCSKCKIEKLNAEFSKCSSTKCGLKAQCKECYKVSDKKYREEAGNEINKQYRKNNKEVISQKRKEYYNSNKERIILKSSKWSKDNPEKSKKSKEKYRVNNLDKINIRVRKYEKKRRLEDPLYKLKKTIRALTLNAFKKVGKKSYKTEKLLGIDIELFYFYISGQFEKGMSFSNHGEWEIDHIYPISRAQSKHEIVELSHYTNLRPLWKNENRKKSNKIINNIQLKLI